MPRPITRVRLEFIDVKVKHDIDKKVFIFTLDSTLSPNPFTGEIVRPELRLVDQMYVIDTSDENDVHYVLKDLPAELVTITVADIRHRHVVTVTVSETNDEILTLMISRIIAVRFTNELSAETIQPLRGAAAIDYINYRKEQEAKRAKT